MIPEKTLTSTLICHRCKTEVEIEGATFEQWNNKLKGWPEGWTCVKILRREVFVSKHVSSLGNHNVMETTSRYNVCPKCVSDVLNDVHKAMGG